MTNTATKTSSEPFWCNSRRLDGFVDWCYWHMGCVDLLCKIIVIVWALALFLLIRFAGMSEIALGVVSVVFATPIFVLSCYFNILSERHYNLLCGGKTHGLNRGMKAALSFSLFLCVYFQQ
jgi:hypothetical protein